ncbi:MAG: hypothetical protein N4A47_00760 [Clostridia bacterium]|jgi:CYTH domain-containing protein|nr:hypothetical protein [Clostridia bacterium]
MNNIKYTIFNLNSGFKVEAIIYEGKHYICIAGKNYMKINEAAFLELKDKAINKSKFDTSIDLTDEIKASSEKVQNEIEKKFLLKKVPDKETLNNTYSYKDIKQFYLNMGDIELRARAKSNSKGNTAYIFTAKSKGLEKRPEFNYEELTEDDFAELQAHKVGSIIAKRRYEIPYIGGYNFEFDVYNEKLEELYTAEIEVNSEDDFSKLNIKSGLHLINNNLVLGNDVTKDKPYKNGSLAINGVPQTYFKPIEEEFEIHV